MVTPDEFRPIIDLFFMTSALNESLILSIHGYCLQLANVRVTFSILNIYKHHHFCVQDIMASFSHHFSSMFIVWMACFHVNVLCALSDLRRFDQPAKEDGSVSFLVVGDWGRKGDYNQSNVAFQMGRIGEDKIYTAKSLQKPWYSVLGNHDYRGNVKAQLSPSLRSIDSRWICLRSFILNAEIVELFFIDTTPFVDKYFLKPKHHHYDWRGVMPRQHYLSNLLKDLESALQDSNANWKIVVGHHPIRSIGHHGETKELKMQLLPLLEANNVDMYINGHDHCLEHITSNTSQVQFLTSGGGSKAWKGDIDRLNKGGVKFFYDGQGFMSLELRQTDVKIVFYDVFGKVLHNFNLFKQLSTAI
ncbi:TARTRATE-RESISTANT ACID PHOSPHATASE TYPE 5 [Salix viminalis]|uniref:acid phosphatase n=1 Tax=Salix viminalis TaxID=40686 RepID=A0A9Q0NWR0_SALVM|nr:TARTRATE-RESISTANT ACID PHOSPHATASE TYPE 5 [Salix viminalis]